jgi:hypothetical protein
MPNRAPSSPLEELAPGLWRFTVMRNGLPPTMTAYALRDGEDTILVDPLVTHGEPVLRDGARALAASLARPRWSRSSLY